MKTFHDWLDSWTPEVREMIRDRYQVRRQHAWHDDETIRAILSVPTHYADLTITAANVALVTGSPDRGNNAGATITAGQLCYKDSSNLWQLSDANLSAASKTIGGVALHGSLANQPLAVQSDGTITIGATVAVGTIYLLSATAGAICPHTDLATGMTTCILGVATTAAIITIRIFNSGVAVP